MIAGQWVYISSPQGNGFDLHTVGFYDPAGEWQPESDHESTAAAAARVHYLSGGLSLIESAASELLEALKETENNLRILSYGYPVGHPTLLTLDKARAAIAKATGGAE